MWDPFRQTWGIGRGSRRMAKKKNREEKEWCSLRQGAGNIWTATHWCGSSKACAQTPTVQPTTSNDNAAEIRLYSLWPCLRLSLELRSHMRRHKETRWAAWSSNRRASKRERVHLTTTTTYVRRITNGMGSGRTTSQASAFSSLTLAHTLRSDPPKKNLGPAQPPPYRCRMFPLLLAQTGCDLLCGLWVWRRRTNRRPCYPPTHRPPNGLHGLTVLDDETIRWLLNTCPEI